MHLIPSTKAHGGLLLTFALAAPGAALAYDEQDAIRDCESRIRNEYKLNDLRDAQAQRLTDLSHHYKIQGQTKLDGSKYPWTCEVKDRHVTAVDYSGPKPKGLGTGEKLAIGAAAAVGGALAINEMSKHGASGGTGGAQELQDLVGAAGNGKYEGQNVSLVHQGNTVRVLWLNTDTGKSDELLCKARETQM